jgi:hypothetical protein
METLSESIFNSLTTNMVVVLVITAALFFRGLALPEKMRGLNVTGTIITSCHTFTLLTTFSIILAFLNHAPQILDTPYNSLATQVIPLLISILICIYSQLISYFCIIDAKDSKKENQNHILKFELSNTAQSFFYVTTILIIGMAVARGDVSITTSIASWLLLFIIDDFIIINDYRRIHQKYAALSHKFRFPVTNVLLFGCNILILQTEPNIWVIAIVGIQLISLALSSEHIITKIFGKKFIINEY